MSHNEKRQDVNGLKEMGGKNKENKKINIERKNWSLNGGIL